jgi:hypothetical protein
VEAKGGGAEVVLRRRDGTVAAVEERGFDHFAGT